MKKISELLTEFREFISRGNVMDLAVGVIIGASFTSIVNSLVNDIIMPIAGMLMGGIDFTSLRFVIRPAADGTAESAIKYGSFIQNIVNFLIIASVVFVIIKALNHFFRKEEKKEAADAKPSEEVQLLAEIRDLLKEKDGCH